MTAVTGDLEPSPDIHVEQTAVAATGIVVVVLSRCLTCTACATPSTVFQVDDFSDQVDAPAELPEHRAGDVPHEPGE